VAMGTFAYASPEMLLGIDSGVKVGRYRPSPTFWELSAALEFKPFPA